MKKHKHIVLEKGAVKELQKKIEDLGKPSVFIGSSYERKVFAEYIRDLFNPALFNVDCWSDGIFGKHFTDGGDSSNLEWLKNFTDIYDFGLFLFTDDDYLYNTRKPLKKYKSKYYKTTKAETTNSQPSKRNSKATRHNVVFEFGLFFGRLGADRSYILKTEKTDRFIQEFFTDLVDDIGEFAGLSKHVKSKLFTIPHKELKTSKNNLLMKRVTMEIVNEIQLDMINEYEVSKSGFLPATALAFGYYNSLLKNFILAIEEPSRLKRRKGSIFKKLVANKKKIIFNILLPTEVNHTEPLYLNKKFQSFSDVSFQIGKDRGYNLKIKNSEATSPVVEFFDIPKTMAATYEAIKLVNPNNDIQELLKAKEQRFFIIKLNEILLRPPISEKLVKLGIVFNIVRL